MPSQETPSYANSLSLCATQYDASYRTAETKNNEIGYTPATMSNLLPVANSLESVLEHAKKRERQISINDLVGYMESPITPIFELMLLFHPVADESSPITAQDFADGKTIPDNYTFSQYAKEKLPLLSGLLPTIRTRDFQDNIARPLIIERIRQEIAEKRKLINESPEGLGAKVAQDEIPVLNTVLDKLRQTLSVPSDIRSV